MIIKAKRSINKIKIDKATKKSLDIFKADKNDQHEQLAVFVHLYYTDLWDAIKSQIDKINFGYDLYVSLPEDKAEFAETIKKDKPGSYTFIAQNHGRDVFPFICMASIAAKRSEYFLKIHSKKSLHREDGNEWFIGMLDSLIPDSKSLQKDIIGKLKQQTTGIIGPKDVYYSLKVNFPANGKHISRVVINKFGRQAARRYLQDSRGDYGFFGGTMFWGRFDSIDKLLDYRAYKFELETGQIDGTFAHALERLFCIVPEIEGKLMYEIQDKNLKQINYADGQIPEWSTDHNK